MRPLQANQVLEVRAVEAAEASVIQAERAVDASFVSIGVSVFAFLALMVTLLQGRNALKKAEKANHKGQRQAQKIYTRVNLIFDKEPNGYLEVITKHLCEFYSLFCQFHATKTKTSLTATYI